MWDKQHILDKIPSHLDKLLRIKKLVIQKVVRLDYSDISIK